MEALVDLLPLLFIGAYYLLASRRRANQKKAAREQAQPTGGPVVAPSEEPSGTPFQSFLAQLEEAMAEASGKPIAEVVPDRAPVLAVEPVPAAEPVPESRLESMEFQSPAGSFDSASPSDHQSHGFGSENPISEEVFEQRPAFAEAAAARETPIYDPHGLRRSENAQAKTIWQQRLGDPKAAQDAFVLQTVFGARGGRLPKQR